MPTIWQFDWKVSTWLNLIDILIEMPHAFSSEMHKTKMKNCLFQFAKDSFYVWLFQVDCMVLWMVFINIKEVDSDYRENSLA